MSPICFWTIQTINHMKEMKVLSGHDMHIVEELKSLESRGYMFWPEIQHLANQLEDEQERRRWDGVCRRLYHKEELIEGAI